jgi:phosphoesterase RecJ-like protein
MEQEYRAIADLIKKSNSFIVASHIDPDGDAIGSQLAIWSILKRLDKSVKVVSEDPVPDTYTFLEGSEEVISSRVEPADVAIVVDSAALHRIGWVSELVGQCSTVVNIDHHASNHNFGDINLVVTGAGAAGEVIYNLSQEMGVELRPNEAEALYVALLSDTGCFRFPNTTSATLRVAADLVDAGVSPYHAGSEIFWKRSEGGLKLLSRALGSIQLSNDGNVATMDITRRMYEETGASPRESEGFANYPRSIKGVKVGVLIRETRDGHFRVSLRSREEFPIAEVAKSFGGGGHPTAAGCRMDGDLESVKTRLRDRIASGVLDPDSAKTSP